MIPILDLKKQIAPLRKEIDAAIKKVVDSASFVFGQEITDFEKAVEKYAQVKYAVGVSNGTDAIKLALLALGIKQNDAVICPAFTYYATTGAIMSIGARPVFADIEADTYNISALSVQKITKSKLKDNLKAIIPVHLYGQCADMDRLLKIAKEFGLKVIEDNAQGFGAEYKGRKSGTIGDCGTVSFFPAKNLGAFGDAGMVLTNHKALAERVKLLHNQGEKEKYHHSVIGYNHRLDTLQAAVLKVKLKYLDLWNKKRQKHAQYYNQNLKPLNLKTPFVAKQNTHIYHHYVLRLDSAKARDRLLVYLKHKGIDCRVYYPLPLHLQECFKHLGYKQGDFPESENAASTTIALPVYPELSKDELDYIIQAIKGFFR